MYLRGVVRVTSYVVITIGLAMLACLIVTLCYGNSPYSLLISGLSSVLFGLLMWVLTKKADYNKIGVAEGCAIVTFSWILTCFFGGMPFFLMGLFDANVMIDPNHWITFTKAYYEAMSGFTTTGSSIFTDVEKLPKDILFWRSLTHWFGGMGIVVLAIAILPKLGIGGMQAFRMEAPGPIKSDKLVPRISQTAKILYTVYFAITVIEAVLLVLVGVNLFDALVHTFGTVGTGGFGVYNTSIAGLHNVKAEYIIGFFMWLSGVNFGLTYLLLWKGEWKAFFYDTEFKVYTAITVIAIALITLYLGFTQFNGMGWVDAFRLAFFQVPTILTTTGYATTDFNLWPAFPVMVLVVLMFIGGCVGSTGGGLKVLRHVINFKYMKHELMRIVKPNIVTTIKVGGRAIEFSIVRSVMALTFIYLVCFAIGTFVLTAFNMDILTAATASIANLGNIGPGLNSVGPAGNYSAVHPIGIWMLTFLMLIGRLEIYTVFALFIPGVWRKKR